MPLACVSEYPATPKAYEDAFRVSDLKRGISDHTEGWALWDAYQPRWYERHVKLATTEGPDAGSFAVLPEELGRIFA